MALSVARGGVARDPRSVREPPARGRAGAARARRPPQIPASLPAARDAGAELAARALLGPYAEQIDSLFELACRRARIGVARAPLSSDAFSRPSRAQLALFEG